MASRKSLFFLGLLLLASFSVGDSVVPIADSDFEIQLEAWTGSADESDGPDSGLQVSFAGFDSTDESRQHQLAPTRLATPSYNSQHASPRPIRAPPVYHG